MLIARLGLQSSQEISIAYCCGTIVIVQTGTCLGSLLLVVMSQDPALSPQPMFRLWGPKKRDPETWVEGRRLEGWGM
jgi:hypothetical protein